jgi:murein DD-endopeptidase MepM/ murein hydrolase activator NlpD
MLKSLAWVFAVFFVAVFGYYLFTTASTALASPGSLFTFPTMTTPLAANSEGGLTSVNVTIFDKGGDGYRYITQGYGRTPYSYRYINHWHNGIDIGADYGASIYSPTNATVLAVGDQDEYCPRLAFGRFIVLQDNTNHLDLLFAHLNDIDVTPGATVKKDERIGTVGASGDETGPHLHFSIFESVGFSMAPAHECGPYPQGHDVNPLNYLGSVYQ